MQLIRTPVQVGVDMSASALSQAFNCMEEALPPGLPLAFHLADMLSFLKQTTATYDVVLAAFSLHHLTPDEKRQVRPHSSFP